MYESISIDGSNNNKTVIGVLDESSLYNAVHVPPVPSSQEQISLKSCQYLLFRETRNSRHFKEELGIDPCTKNKKKKNFPFLFTSSSACVNKEPFYKLSHRSIPLTLVVSSFQDLGHYLSRRIGPHFYFKF